MFEVGWGIFVFRGDLILRMRFKFRIRRFTHSQEKKFSEDLILEKLLSAGGGGGGGRRVIGFNGLSVG